MYAKQALLKNKYDNRVSGHPPAIKMVVEFFGSTDEPPVREHLIRVPFLASVAVVTNVEVHIERVVSSTLVLML